MKKSTTTKPSRIYIKHVENLYISESELATTNVYIEHVENLHMGKLELATTATSHDESPTTPHQPPIPTLTNSQLVLAFYYGLQSGGFHARVNVDMAFIARLMHLATARPYTDVHNSEFYKKLRRAPNFKPDRALIKDLEVIKRRLLEVGLKEAASLVDKEISLAHQEINNSFK